MKKLIIIICLLSSIIFFLGCTKLTITNNTSYDLDLITWIDDAELPLHKGFDERYWPEQRITCLTYTRDVEKESLMFSRIHRGLEELDKLVKELEKK